MVFYTGLARLARDAGLVVREVNGWKSRTLGTRPNGMAGARGCLWHHTATSASAVRARNNPTLNYMVNGLGYPLANFGLAWDGSIDVIAAGAAAHAGKGRYGSRIPRDRGNDYLLGVEVEGTTGLTWSDAQLESATRLGHAMNKEWGSSFLQIGHNEYAPGRKIDPTGIPGGMPVLRKAISRGYWTTKTTTPAKASAPSKPKGTLSVSDVNKIMSELNKKASANQVNQVFVRQREYQNEALELIDSRASKSMVNSVFVRQREYQAETEELIRQLAEATGTEIDYDKVREAAKTGAKEALAEGIDIEAEVTFHSPDEDQGE